MGFAAFLAAAVMLHPAEGALPAASAELADTATPTLTPAATLTLAATATAEATLTPGPATAAPAAADSATPAPTTAPTETPTPTMQPAAAAMGGDSSAFDVPLDAQTIGCWRGSAASGDVSGESVPGRLLVKFVAGASSLAGASLLSSVGAQTVGEIEALGVRLVDVAGKDALRAAQLLQASPLVEYAEPDYVVSADAITPNDPSYSAQWGPAAMQAPAAWSISTGATSVVIAIIDTGVDLPNLEFAGKIVAGCDYVNRDDSAQDDNGHGTHVAGIAAAIGNNSSHMAGISWGARVMPLKVLSASGRGSTSAISAAIIYAADHGAKVINLSLGGPGYSSTQERAVNYAVARGVVVVASAGNNGNSTPNYPAAYANAIAVAATNSSNLRASFSNFGSYVDLAAPGYDVLSLRVGTGTVRYDGTSMASPHVAGAAAIIAGVLGSGASVATIRSVLESTALDLGSAGRDDYYGKGLVNLYAALVSVVPPTATATATLTATPTATLTNTPTPMGFVNIGSRAIASGREHTCAITSNGAVKCWGYNGFGQLGDGTTTTRLTPVDVSGLSSGGVAIAAGSNHTCALNSAGAVKCWGSNRYGQLGDGSNWTITRLAPVDVSGLSSGVVAIAAGESHTCAVTSAGAVKCWGANHSNQLGDGIPHSGVTGIQAERRTPVDVSGLSSGVVAIAAGAGHTCALTSGGAMKCWGSSGYGQLGEGTNLNRLTPVDVSGLGSGVSAIAAGSNHTCALMSSGAVKCWGQNNSGQVLGDGYYYMSPLDVTGLSSGVAAIAAGADHTCAVTTAGAVKCWGYNLFGQLGDGTATDRRYPVDVSGISSGVTAVSAGTKNTCARTSAGAVMCWGGNDYGVVGDDTTTQRLVPVDVVGFGRAGTMPVGTATAGPTITPTSSQSAGIGVLAHLYGSTEDTGFQFTMCVTSDSNSRATYVNFSNLSFGYILTVNSDLTGLVASEYRGGISGASTCVQGSMASFGPGRNNLSAPLKPGTTYYLQVWAINNGTRVVSPTLVVRTQGGTTTPAAPTATLAPGFLAGLVPGLPTIVMPEGASLEASTWSRVDNLTGKVSWPSYDACTPERCGRNGINTAPAGFTWIYTGTHWNHGPNQQFFTNGYWTDGNSLFRPGTYTNPVAQITMTPTPANTSTPTATPTPTATVSPTPTPAMQCWEGSAVSSAPSDGAVPNQVLVKFAEGTSDSVIAAYVRGVQGRVSAEMEELGVVVLDVPRGKVAGVVADLQRLAIVEYAEPNFSASAFDTTPNDARWAEQYGPAKVQAPAAWDLSTGSSGVTIAVVDTGVQSTHPEFAGRLVAGCDFVNRDALPEDDNGHGTHVAGIAAAAGNNSVGIAGISWGARIMALKALDATGSGTYQQIAQAIVYAADNGAKVINLSLGGSEPSSVLEDAVNYAVAKGAVVVAAAGNSGTNSPNYPAAYAAAIAVAATDSSNVRASFSNYGSYVDLSAPGVSILSTFLSSGYSSKSGTSMAAPHVAGAAALLMSYSSAFTTPAQVRAALETSALDLGTSGRDNYYGYGLVQLRSAMQFNAASALPTVTPAATVAAPGYVLARSDTCPARATYAWVDATGGTRVVLADDGAQTVALPFTFRYGGVDYAQAAVGSNGLLSFGIAGADSYSNAAIPVDYEPNNFIAALWDDLDPATAGTVHWLTTGSAPNRKFVVQWTAVPHWGVVGGQTFEVILEETTNAVVLQYGAQAGTYAGGNSATVGLEYGDGGAGTQFAFNTANAVSNGLALRYTVGDGSATPVPAATCAPAATPTAAARVQTFADVPLTHPYYPYIEALYQAGYTAGCSTSPLMYCPDKNMTRAEAAVFVMRGFRGGAYQAPVLQVSSFGDVDTASWSSKWAAALYGDGLTAGCSAPTAQNPARLYCPWQGHSRVEGAVFYMRVLRGASYTPPAATGLFSDLDNSWWGTKWAEAAYTAGIAPPCASEPLQFCANAPLNRDVAAYMLVRAKNLTLP